MYGNLNKVCNKCGDPQRPPEANHCDQCWYGGLKESDITFRMDYHHQVVDRYIPDEAKRKKFGITDEEYQEMLNAKAPDGNEHADK